MINIHSHQQNIIVRGTKILKTCALLSCIIQTMIGRGHHMIIFFTFQKIQLKVVNEEKEEIFLNNFSDRHIHILSFHKNLHLVWYSSDSFLNGCLHIFLI